MLVLSAIWFGLLAAELAGVENRVLSGLGLTIWVVFIAEFALRFSVAPAKGRFLLANLLSMAALVLPAFRLLRIVRFVRVAPVARLARGATLIRVVAGVNRSMNALRRAMGRRGFGYVLALTAVVCLLGAFGMRQFEADGPNAAEFSSFGDALWWTAMILTTMGSQAWPATPEGRLLAVLLSTYAFAVFGYVAAALASFFIGRDQPEQAPRRELRALRDELRSLRAEVRALAAERRGPKVEEPGLEDRQREMGR